MRRSPRLCQKRCFTPWSVLLIIFLLPLISTGQENSQRAVLPRSQSLMSIDGLVKCQDTLKPIKSASVELYSAVRGPITTVYTDSSGLFRAFGLDDGQHRIVVTADGYARYEQYINPLTAPLGLVVHMSKAGPPAPERPPNPLISIQELALPRKLAREFEKGCAQLYQKNDAKGGYQHLKRVVKEAPFFFEGHYHLALACLRLGKIREAEVHLLKSLDGSHSHLPQTYLHLSSLLNNDGRFPEALPLTKKAVTLDADGWQAYFEMARALVGLNRLSEGLQCLRSVQALNPSYPEQYLLTAKIHNRRFDARATLEALDTYLRLQPGGPLSEEVRQARRQVQASMAPDQPPVFH